VSATTDDPEQADLLRWGWDDGWQRVLAADTSEASQSDVARVVVGHRGEVDVARGEVLERAALSPALRKIATPIVGDFVRLGGRGARGLREVVRVLPRRTELVRKAAGRATGAQAIGANVDVVMLATALVFDLNVRRLERFLALVAESGARPVVVLTKADLVTAESAESTARKVREVLGEAVPVHVTSAISSIGLEALEPYFAGQRTIALLGSSGVGKSTLLNAWLATDDAHAVGGLRGDGRGKHTTTRRELVVRPRGGLVLDTPGVREVGLWLDRDESALDDTFPEVAAVATGCRFTDCAHGTEPGCAVVAGVESGTLDPARVRSFLALRGEARETATRRLQRPRGRR
jgi:ribosome biogenesis GTPase